VRALAVQRILAQGDKAPIVALACSDCGHSMVSPTQGWLQPTTRHSCDACGAENRTRRRSFVNPLAEKLN
jgi:DNA replicative helicase MCM subunit Mcm2 (Cdc46/Mcm family)